MCATIGCTREFIAIHKPENYRLGWCTNTMVGILDIVIMLPCCLLIAAQGFHLPELVDIFKGDHSTDSQWQMICHVRFAPRTRVVQLAGMCLLDFWLSPVLVLLFGTVVRAKPAWHACKVASSGDYPLARIEELKTS